MSVTFLYGRGMKSFLVDGPLMLALERRKALLPRMANVLAESGAQLVTDADAVRVLLAKGFHYLDVAVLAGEARMLAYQEIVAAEMSKP